ncbi:MAG: TauD/TfdA family dioxygenase [Rhodospirillales bacterium]|nr:TauD/TfdA family dioxygenase [Rhodospirillales bacterium]
MQQNAERLNEPFRHFTATPVTGRFGAEISDIDLNNLDDEMTQELRAALLKYHVIFFRDQDFSPESQTAFAQRFGALNRHPYVKGMDGHPDVFRIVKQPTDTHHFGEGWHTDLSYTETPAMGTILYGVEVPVAGGDTMFSSLAAAYEGLSEGLKELIADLKAVYTNANTYSKESPRFQLGVSKGMQVQTANTNEVEHPVVRTHPETGLKSLYLSPLHFNRFVGMTPEQSKPLFDTLVQHVTQPEFTCRFRWQNGSVAFWDNRCTMHYAINDLTGVTRIMQRVTLEGDRPY